MRSWAPTRTATAAKSGNPSVLSGPDKGTPFPLLSAAVRRSESHLLCYAVAPTKKRIEQNGCGPATAGDEAVPIGQVKHAPRVGAHVADQLGTRRIDTKKETLLCVPATLPGS